ncbi:MAG: hypothetical protein WCW68_12890 [Methanothrix sp.]
MDNAIIKLIKPLINIYVYFFLALIIISSFISTSLQSNTLYNSSINIKFADNIFRVLAGAAAGGLLTVLVLNHTARVRADHTNKAIVWRLVELSAAVYVDILGNYGRGEFLNRLYGSGFGLTNGSDYIEEIIYLLKQKAGQLENEECTLSYTFYNRKDFTYHTYGYYKYDRTIKYVEDLTNIYYMDSIYNTTDKYILEELYHCTNWGLKLLGLLEGDFKQSSRLWSLAHFLELNLKLYRILLSQFGVNVEKDIKVRGAKA